MMDRFKQHLRARHVEFAEHPNGDIFFRRGDGQGMFLRAYPDGAYDWCVNAGRNDTNLMDFRPRESHDAKDVLRRVDDFLDGAVSGGIILDTLGLLHALMAQGMSREEAEKAVGVVREFVLAMHESGMDAKEIRNRFTEIQGQLRRETIGQGSYNTV